MIAPAKDEAAVAQAGELSLSGDSPASGPTPYSADEDGREVEHDNMTP